MSLHDFRMKSLRDQIAEEAEKAEVKIEKEEEKDLKRSVIIKKKSKKN